MVGLGETYAAYFIPEAVPSIVDFFAPVLIGQDPVATTPMQLRRRMEECGGFWWARPMMFSCWSLVNSWPWPARVTRPELAAVRL